MKTYNISIIGATGVVGGTLLEILEQRKFPINKLFLVAGKRTAGEKIEFNHHSHVVTELSEFDFSQSEISFFCTSNDLSKEYVPKAVAAGNIVIDKSSYYRYDKDVPLIIPEVNAAAIKDFRKKNIVANPNCSTTPIVVALKPIHDKVGVKRINVATYQSVSGSGAAGVKELAEQTAQILNNHDIQPHCYQQQIAFNVLPFIDDFQDNGYTKEEMKIVWETRKILNDDSIAINPTAVRVPVFYGHSAAVHIETHKKISAKEVAELLKQAPGVKLLSGNLPYPTPVTDAAGNDEVFVGRIREDISCENGIDFWVVTDNLRKGAALNAVQIAELLLIQL